MSDLGEPLRDISSGTSQLGTYTAPFDERRMTISSAYPATLQQYFSRAEWSTLVDEVNEQGAAFQQKVEEITNNANPGVWMACACLCCICGPCILGWKLKNIAVTLVDQAEAAIGEFERTMKALCFRWQTKKGIGIILQSEEANRLLEVHTAVEYNKYWIQFGADTTPCTGADSGASVHPGRPATVSDLI